jgi:uncharacterized protein YlzI (FlbEa/FlbD family)
MLPDRSITIFKINRFSTADKVYEVTNKIIHFFIYINIILDYRKKN